MLVRIDISTDETGQSPVRQVNEGEALKLTLRALNDSLAVVTPTSMRYRIQSIDTGETVLDWTSLTPSTAVSVIITGAQNAIRCGGTERRAVIAEATDSDGLIRRVFEYDVVDLQGI